jgi:tetratricopeptide (TPR) repeat protein
MTTKESENSSPTESKQESVSTLSAADAPPAATSIVKRMAVLGANSETADLLGILSLEKNKDNQCTFRLSRSSADFEAKAREITLQASARALGTAAALGFALDDDAVIKLWEQTKECIVAQGFGIEEIPNSDHALNFTVDMKTGRAVAQTTALQRIAGDSEELSANLMRTLQGAFQNPILDCVREVRDAVSKDDHTAAARILRDYNEKGAFGLHLTETLLDTLLAVRVEVLDTEDRQYVRKLRVAVAEAVRQFDVAGAESTALLKESPNELGPELIFSLRMMIGIAEAREGRPETAMAIWREQLSSEGAVSPATRGWLYRNMSMTIPATDPDAGRYAKLSADAFLEAGLKSDAVGSMMRAVDCQIFEEPQKAISLLTEVIEWFEPAELSQQDKRAYLLQFRAKRFLQLRQYRQARDDAEEAIRLRESHLGQESARIGSYHIAAIASDGIGDKDTAKRYRQLAVAKTQASAAPRYLLADKVVELFQSYDAAAAQAIVKDAIEAGFNDIAAAVKIAIAQYDSSLDFPGRLSKLEALLADLDSDKDDETKESVKVAIAMQLQSAGDEIGAMRWYEKALIGNPLNSHAEHSFLTLCEKLQMRPKIVSHLREQTRRFGFAPNRGLYLGRCLIEMGRPDEAIDPLRQVRNDPKSTVEQQKSADDLMLRAMHIGANTQRTPPPATLQVSREELELALADFASIVEAHVRMSFWRRANDGGKKWVESPERVAQDFLKLFVKTKFADRVDVFEEVSAGAGRLDILLSFYGGLTVILELKMCGLTYPSTYAFSGTDQILHYMRNLKKALGYLVVFDARKRDFGKGIDRITNIDTFTVVTAFIDVRAMIDVS